MKKLLIALMAIISVFALTGCDSDTNPDTLTYESVTVDKLGLSLEKPNGWYQPGSNLEEEGYYEFIVPNQFSADDKIEGSLYIELTPFIEGMTLEDSYEVLEEVSAETGYRDFKFISQNKDLTILGAPAKELTYSYTEEFEGDRPSITSEALVITSRGLYRIGYNDETTDYNKFRKVLDHLYTTLKEV